MTEIKISEVVILPGDGELKLSFVPDRTQVMLAGVPYALKFEVTPDTARALALIRSFAAAAKEGHRGETA